MAEALQATKRRTHANFPKFKIGQMENPFRRFKAQAAGAIHDQLRDEFEDFIRAKPHIIGEQSALDWWF
ncbi:hypothetical protein AU210_012462 [Fusarium oxysporum f. sp. radicis-cucumerinum]|uniref:Uncharacterized protein n=1 Tax=Fusarium oxysporum f. sp. radicis-cucumerinum TaxID=327505 RepID=A0A2H3GLT9_FUSOX|nr:hypothetical protein AU210_012462 [Fusarium oxysporum f. sp. radicis-cucumerinum]